jgi:two-component system sensor histidine kinase KdpD
VSILVFDFAFVPPYYTFHISDWEYFISFIGYVVIAFVISTLATQLRHLIPQIWRSTAEVEAVSGLSRDLATAQSRQDIYETLVRHMHQYASGHFAVLTPELGRMTIQAGDGMYPMNEKERSIAQWAFDNGAVAGRGTETIPSGTGHYVPMKAHSVVFGVLAFVFDRPDEMLIPEQQEVLQTMAFWGAMALERVKAD